jgi:hypothetical protein
MENPLNLRRTSVLLVLLSFLAFAGQVSFGWGKAGHKIVNRVAIQMLPSDMPAFMHTPAALNEIEYLGPEPDRWRSSAEPELNASQAPDHFIDLELADLAVPNDLPKLRFDFIRDLYQAQTRYPNLATKLTPQRVGLLPWQVNEQFERLEADMREYRKRLAAHQSTQGGEQAILYDAGVLGHYVADGSQPLHTTIDYNGWVELENPDGFTRAHSIHARFETEFVQANLRARDIRPLVPAAPHILMSPFHDYVAYLRASHSQVAELYRLEHQGGFEGIGTAQSRRFVAERLAAAAAMLRDMIATAWVESAQISSWHNHAIPAA